MSCKALSPFLAKHSIVCCTVGMMILMGVIVVCGPCEEGEQRGCWDWVGVWSRCAINVSSHNVLSSAVISQPHTTTWSPPPLPPSTTPRTDQHGCVASISLIGFIVLRHLCSQSFVRTSRHQFNRRQHKIHSTHTHTHIVKDIYGHKPLHYCAYDISCKIADYPALSLLSKPLAPWCA